ncbi:hypothetical protein RB195_009847 [Necator americanus]|uniref:Uncharacterized protein n=1 Tax=Necator americanus TaxID=51031 RepID=A0ABR1CV96_NECAM
MNSSSISGAVRFEPVGTRLPSRQPGNECVAFKGIPVCCSPAHWQSPNSHRSLPNEQPAAPTRILRYLCVSFAAVQETRIRGRSVISIGDYAIDCVNIDERKVESCTIAVRNEYNKLVEEFRSTSSRSAYVRQSGRREQKLWILRILKPTLLSNRKKPSSLSWSHYKETIRPSRPSLLEDGPRPKQEKAT